MQCPHCGAVFDAPTFEAHVMEVSKNASWAEIARWLHEWAMERERR